MFHAIARRRTMEVFERLSRAEWELIVDTLATDVHHVFPGTHPLGGERRDRAAVAQWFERLGRLFPGHEFEVHRVISGGRPWDMWVAVQWSAELRPAVGEAYENHGAHWIRIQWGKVTDFHAYLDTQLIVEACEVMARGRIEEAAAPPIE